MIEQIKEQLARKYENDFIVSDGTKETDFIAGFDACMDLELPIKFAEWLSNLETEIEIEYQDEQYYEANYYLNDKECTIKEIFNYWIENIYNK